MHFTKLEALGNDFLLIDETEARYVHDPGALSVRMCRRTEGAGADGLLVLGPADPAEAEVTMRIFNADGSEAEVSGNGTRCTAAYLDTVGRWPLDTQELRVSTAAGVKRMIRAGESSYEMDMGRPSFRSGDVPYSGLAEDEHALNATVEASGRAWNATISSVGNPHCSIILENPDAVDWRNVGAAIECHPSFPNRVNVEFVRIVDRDLIEVRFWERGVGETQSSGTGATAATAAAIATGRVNRKVTVRSVSGDLSVEWPDDNASIRLTGPARLVYRGEWLEEKRATD